MPRLNQTNGIVPGPLRAAASLWTLFFGIALLMIGHGLQGSLLGVRADAEGFSSTVTGLVMSSYFVGFIAGSRLTPGFLRNVGHIRVFAAFASLASISVLIHMLLVEPWVWALMRLLSGFAYAGLYIVVESWLNDRAGNEDRGGLLSIYVITAYLSMGGGQLLLNLADPGTFVLFALISILVSFSLVPILLSVTRQPAFHEAEAFGLRELMQLSPLATIGTLISGMGRGAFFGMGAVYASQAGLSVAQISMFMTVVIAGGALLQWPMGRLSDHSDRRIVLIAVALLAAGVATALALYADAGLGFLILAGVFGGTMLPLHPILNAHINDYLEPRQIVAAGSGLILIQGIGAAIGPFLAGWAMELSGPGAFFWYLAGMHLALSIFAAWRLARHSFRQRRPSSRYMPTPAQTPASYLWSGETGGVDREPDGSTGPSDR